MAGLCHIEPGALVLLQFFTSAFNCILQESPVHYLDATAQEEAATPLRLLLVFSFPPSAPADVQAMRMLGPGELTTTQLKDLVKVCQILDPSYS